MVVGKKMLVGHINFVVKVAVSESKVYYLASFFFRIYL